MNDEKFTHTVNDNPDPELDSESLSDTTTQAEDYKDLYLRSQAEMQNMMRRHDNDMLNAKKYALERFLTALLPVLDSINSAIMLDNHSKSAEGVIMTRSIMLDIFSKFGIEVIKVKPGDMFNPEEHEALKVEKGTDGENNVVLYEIQTGYKLNNRVVRPARICVSN